jgi:hypothetical protein
MAHKICIWAQKSKASLEAILFGNSFHVNPRRENGIVDTDTVVRASYQCKRKPRFCKKI